ncbi:hypothetical protein ACQEU3_43260 [Spirillospora sp. CA-253888]
MDENDLTADPVRFLIEILQSEAAMSGSYNAIGVIGYDGQERRDQWLAAVDQVAELLGCPIEVIDSGFFEDGFGHLKIRRSDTGPGVAQDPSGRIPQQVIDAYEAANRLACLDESGSMGSGPQLTEE